ncbi:uncharacterized protein LOC133951410 [Platichthys flesus]|uniref:uncharacterized protein LOC133951410 n=1 Tax=Platichthys flesus TaxID=8260 RepID=UPI002DB5CABC|nr:uncharacterized protein LOC133951410 [Platichthys flesus]
MDFPTTVILVGLIVALLWVLTVKSRRKYNLPPGPVALPLVGNLPQLDKNAPFKSFLKLSETYGPVMTLHMGWQRTVVLVGYDAVKEALVDQGEDFMGRGPLPFLMRATRGYGLGISNGERWRQLRRFTLSTLRDFGMGRKGMEEWIQEESQHLRDRIDSFKAAPFDPTLLLSCTVSNVICCMVFGQRFSYEDKQFLKLLNIMSEMLKFESSPLCQMYNVFPWLMERLPGRQHYFFARIDELRDFIKTKINEHKDTLDPSSPRDFIDSFLIRSEQEKNKPTTEFHHDNMVSTVFNLFLAGTETTSSTIRYALSVFIKYPDIQEKMQQEIDSVVGKDRCPKMEDRKSLPFTYAVIHEVQRFLDIVPLNLPHYTLTDISFRGYTIPKDTTIIPLLHSVLRDDKQWASPWTFNPQHFLDPDGNFKKNPASMPFGAGKRACVGESLALMELFIFLVSLLQRFTFSCTDGPDSIDMLPEYGSFANLPRRYKVIAAPRILQTGEQVTEGQWVEERRGEQSNMDFPTTVILAGLIVALLWVLTVKSRRKYNLPPGPVALPLVGNLPQLDKNAPFKSFLKLSETYGPVMTLHLGWQRTVVLVGYDAVKEALVDQADDFTGRGPLPFLMKATRGYGLGISNGERWRQLRRFTLSTLRDFGMGRKGMEEWIQEESQHLRERIDSFKAAPFDPTFQFSLTVSNVICCMVFGERFCYEDKQFLQLLNIISETLQFGSSPLGQMYNVFPWLMERLPGRQHYFFARIEEVRDFIEMKIHEHKDTLDPSSPRDYIDCFLVRSEQEKNNPTNEFHHDNLVSTVLNLFLAGTETTSSTIRYAISVLIKYPDIQEKMQQEIDRVVGKDRCPKMEDRKSLPFTDAVIHEVQRFLDIVPFSLPHYALTDISFRGYTIPKDTAIIPLLHSVLKDEKQWASPWTFNPQHFLDPDGNLKKNPAFMPFAAGKRACVGEALARMELFIFMVSLLQRFTFSCTDGPDSINLVPEYSSFANLPRRYKVIAAPR